MREVTVISTGFKSDTKWKCINSVAEQRGVTAHHIYIEASEQSPPRAKITNLIDVIAPLSPDRIVALVDGDDWLAHEHALASSTRFYDSGALLTYGSFSFPDAPKVQRGCSAHVATIPPRKDVWRASHLKTFRAGLFHRIRPADLELNGAPIAFGDDFAFMIPMLEMAGLDRAFYNPEVVYVYDLASANAFYRDKSNVEGLAAVERYVRGLPAYSRLSSLDIDARQ